MAIPGLKDHQKKHGSKFTPAQNIPYRVNAPKIMRVYWPISGSIAKAFNPQGWKHALIELKIPGINL